MNEVFVILYENDAPNQNGKPARGIVNYAFSSFEQAVLQAEKADKKHYGIRHWVTELKIVKD